MSTVKKVFVELHSFLVANKDKKISTVMDDIEGFMSTKARGTTAGSLKTGLKDTNGNVVAILDYYYKRWMPLVGEQAVEFGKKTGSATGFNQMCKDAVSHWTKQQSVSKKANAELLTLVGKGEVAPSDIAAHQATIEAERTKIVPTELGFATMEELVQYLNENGVDLPAGEVAEDTSAE